MILEFKWEWSWISIFFFILLFQHVLTHWIINGKIVAKKFNLIGTHYICKNKFVSKKKTAQNTSWTYTFFNSVYITWRLLCKMYAWDGSITPGGNDDETYLHFNKKSLSYRNEGRKAKKREKITISGGNFFFLLSQREQHNNVCPRDLLQLWIQMEFDVVKFLWKYSEKGAIMIFWCLWNVFFFCFYYIRLVYILDGWYNIFFQLLPILPTSSIRKQDIRDDRKPILCGLGRFFFIINIFLWTVLISMP